MKPRPQNVPAEEELLTPSEAARIPNISSRTLERWAKQGIVASLRLPNGQRRYRRDAIEALLTDGSDAADLLPTQEKSA